MQTRHPLRGALAAFAAAGLLAAFAPPSAAQSFSAFLPVSVQSGLLLRFDDTVVTDLATVGGAGKYTTGYAASGTPIVLQFTASDGSGFGGVIAGDTLTVTRIGAFYLVDADGITANHTGSTVYKQDGTTPEGFSWVSQSTSGGGNAGVGYADDSSGFFSDSKKFLADANSEGSGGDKPLFGDFNLANVSAGGTANPTGIGFDLGGFVNGQGRFVTGHVRLVDLGVPPSSVPEPGPLALVACASVPVIGLVRRRRA